RGHRHRHVAHQVVVLAGEQLVVLHVHFHVEVAGGTTPGADLALAGELDPGAVIDAGRHLDRQRPPGPYPAVAGALRARIRNHTAVSGTGRAGSGGADVTEERPLHVLHLAPAVAGAAGDRLGAGRRPRAGAGGALHGGVHLELAGCPEGGLGELDTQPDQGVLAAPGPRPRAALGVLSEEGVHDVAEGEALPEVSGPAAGAERVSPAVVE